MSNELAVVSFDQIKSMADALGKTKLFGKTPEELIPLMLIAQAEGKHPASAAQEYDIIQGRPALNAKSILARFQASGGKSRWDVRTDTQASIVVSHPVGGEVAVTWTIADAKRAGLADKATWKQYPRAMLAARAEAEAVRACFPACLNGMYAAAEVEDFDIDMPRQTVIEQKGTGSAELAPKVAERNVTPEAEPEATPEAGKVGLF